MVRTVKLMGSLAFVLALSLVGCGGDDTGGGGTAGTAAAGDGAAGGGNTAGTSAGSGTSGTSGGMGTAGAAGSGTAGVGGADGGPGTDASDEDGGDTMMDTDAGMDSGMDAGPEKGVSMAAEESCDETCDLKEMLVGTGGSCPATSVVTVCKSTCGDDGEDTLSDCSGEFKAYYDCAQAVGYKCLGIAKTIVLNNGSCDDEKTTLDTCNGG